MPLCGENITCSNILLILLNTLFAITGIVLTIEGVRAGAMTDHYKFLTDGNLFNVGPLFLLTAGTGTCLVSLPGYYAVTKGKCMMITIQFGVFLIIFFIGELVVGITGCMMQKDLAVNIEARLNETLIEYPTNAVVRKNFDIVQTDLECCGVRGTMDWRNGTLPAACCMKLDAKSQCTKASPTLHNKGCLGIVQGDIQEAVMIFSVLGLGVPLVHLMIFFICFALIPTSEDEYEAL